MTESVRIAGLIRDGYRAYRARFQDITRAAGARFRAADWLAVQDANAERLALYGVHVRTVVDAILAPLRVRARPEPAHSEDAQNSLPDPLVASIRFDWPRIRAAYISLIAEEYNAELFETFFNSVHRTLTDDSDVNDAEMFVTSAFPMPPVPAVETLTRQYRPTRGAVEMMHQIARELPFDRAHPDDLAWQDLDRDIGNVLRSLVEARPEIDSIEGIEVEILRPLFYRNKGAYVVGRLSWRGHYWPLALPLLLDGQRRVYIDTLICDADELSVMFSFTRAYFMVLEAHPHALVDFLSDMLPNKKRSELYASIGLHKHGKTVFYRDLLEHLAHSDDPFVIAAGIKGMVMSVFTLPSYQTVFKIIKDRFAPQKHITRAQVREQYYMVKKHDRVGRMADTQEFENLILPRARFSPALLEELRAVAASSVEITDETVRIQHLYTERLMTPLNLYIETADENALREVLDEYGNAIKQLSAANIFPGDMLLKNFGVTRHGRVVFYDYDEICYLTDVNFRAIPEPTTPDQELAADAWYTVAPNDVFPEEFRRFLFGKPRIKQLFTDMHGDLFDPTYWQGLQAAIRNGQVMDVFPYRRKKRFLRRPRDQGDTAAVSAPAATTALAPELGSAAVSIAAPISAAAFSAPAANAEVRYPAVPDAAPPRDPLTHFAPAAAEAAGGLVSALSLGAQTGMKRVAVETFTLAPGEERSLQPANAAKDAECFVYVISGRGSLRQGTQQIAVGAGDAVGLRGDAPGDADAAAVITEARILNDGETTLTCLLATR